MLTIKHMTNDGVTIYASETVSFVDDRYGSEELKCVIADLDLQSDKPTHTALKAAVYFNNTSLHIYPDDQLYITDSGGNTVHCVR